MTNKSNETNNEQCCASGCGCGCTSSQLANFIRHIASYFDKKE